MPELQDVLDEKGELTGEQLTKDEIFKRGLWRKVVHIWLVDSNKRLLVQRRALKKGIFDGLWDVTVGGGVAAGEEPVDAAIRELKEELGIAADLTDLTYIDRYKLPKTIPETGERMNDFSYTFMLSRDIDIQELQMEPREVSSVRLMKLSDLNRSISNPAQSKLWVPHGTEYYVQVANKCMELAV